MSHYLMMITRLLRRRFHYAERRALLSAASYAADGMTCLLRADYIRIFIYLLR